MKFSSLNYDNISLYLRYGIISFPGLKIKKEKSLKLTKIKGINFNQISYTDVLNSILYSIDKQILKSKKKRKR